jgi:beta-fructofuranosidase
MPAVPEILLRKLFVQGSLSAHAEGFSFILRNTLLAVTVIGMEIAADDSLISPVNVVLRLEGGDGINAEGISLEHPLALPLNVPLLVTVISPQAQPKKLTITAETNEVGKLRFSVNPAPSKPSQFSVSVKRMQQGIQQLARERKASRDPHHPIYHFTPPANWMNDPNGLITWQGQMHLFYQYNPYAPGWGSIHWGHAVSRDLVLWKRLPIALAPQPGKPNQDGCWSGTAVITENGPMFFYTGVFPETVCAARPDKDLLHLIDDPDNPLIAEPPSGLELEGFRDPCVWQQDEFWYMTIGSGSKGKGGMILLYRSSDLKDWQYIHPLIVGNQNESEPFATGRMWECPQLVKIGARHFLFISAILGPQTQYPFYFSGRMNGMKFIPESRHRVDGGNALYAPLTFEDVSDRRVLFGWVREEREESACQKAGWSGALSLPRILSLSEKNELLIDPAPELEKLRRKQLASYTGMLNMAPVKLSGKAGLKNCEFNARIIAAESDRIDFLFGESLEGPEKTQITYDTGRHTLIVDTTSSSFDPSTHGQRMECPVPVGTGGTIDLRVFLDGSILEVYANRRVVLTTRVYPTRMKNIHLFVRTQEGTGRMERFALYEMGNCIQQKS